MSKFFQFNLKSFFFELADKNKDQVLDGDEIEILFNRFPNRFAGFNIMSLLKKNVKENRLTKDKFVNIFKERYAHFDEDRDDASN